jgi:hypothetical protein
MRNQSEKRKEMSLKENSYVSEEHFKKRMTTCYSCKSYNEILRQCKECKCFLFLKAFLISQKCPLDKW